MLRTLDLIPSPFDFNILCKKFEDRETGDVNYALFCQMVEQGKIRRIKRFENFFFIFMK